MAKRKSATRPPPFNYSVSSPHFGVFVWDGSEGVATYQSAGKLVHRGMTFVKPFTYTYDHGNSYDY